MHTFCLQQIKHTIVCYNSVLPVAKEYRTNLYLDNVRYETCLLINLSKLSGKYYNQLYLYKVEYSKICL